MLKLRLEKISYTSKGHKVISKFFKEIKKKKLNNLF
jgi:hypothetical protein